MTLSVFLPPCPTEMSSNIVNTNVIDCLMHDHTYAETLVPLVSGILGSSISLPDVSSAATSFTDSRSPSTSTSSGSLSVGLDLAKEYLTRRIKPSTKSHYDRVYQIWQNFCSENNLQEFEAGHEALASCLSLVMKDSGSLGKVTMLSAAIANEYRRNLKTSPTEHRCISDLFKGFRASAETSRQTVLPITETIVRQMIDKVYHPSHGRDGQKASLVLWRTAWRVLMEFNTLGRFSDIVRLTRADVRFGTSPSPHLKLLFKGGKNDFYSEGADRIVASNSYEPCYCPVIFTKNYFEFLGYNFDGFLVPACLPNARPNPLKTVPYNGALDDLRTLLNELGYDGKHYGEHSGKRGGATAAVENGMDMDTLKRLGRWRSATIPSKYVDLGTGARIEMSKLLQKRL